MTITTRVCTKCEEEKAAEGYYRHSGGTLYGECKECHADRASSWRSRNKDKWREYSRRSREKLKRALSNEEWVALQKDGNLRHKFNMTLEDYHQLWGKQEGLCAICKNPETATRKGVLKHLAVDHCHDTGRIRGLLCAKCNTAIRSFGDDTNVIAAAIQYLLTN
jgi:hypothetical protein|tara:strand:- start:7 stop:498 length:492 start_codon:yes stop_codon:yes gene_type:complete